MVRPAEKAKLALTTRHWVASYSLLKDAHTNAHAQVVGLLTPGRGRRCIHMDG